VTTTAHTIPRVPALIARAALALMALHIIDDSFLQPAAGTSAGDHLVSGLVPLAGLAAAAWAFGRLRPGAAASLALLLTPLGFAVGAEAIYYGNAVGLSGDDYTGLLALVAGPALLAAATGFLWSSRRLDDRRAWRYPRRGLLALGGLLGFLMIAAPLGLAYGFTHITRAEVPVANLGVEYEKVTLRTADGLALAGWYIPSRNGAAVMVYPGRATAQKHARYLSRQGYGVLMVDRRGEGASEGDPHAFGWTFDADIRAGVAFLEQRPDVQRGRIGGLGLSVGGEMMLQTAGDTKGLAAVVSDGAGARVMAEELADIDSLPVKALNAPLVFVKTAAVAVFSNQVPPHNLTDYIAEIAPRPVLLIHAARGEVDEKTPEYLAAARGHAEDWEVPKGGHTAGIRTMPQEYARRVVGFFDRTL
jgi:fermentation-respiration switch protein FrsA (DUF1100 family)